MTSAERIAQEERRADRLAWRAAGGSERRPLKSFRTAAEKREAKLEHAERIHAATEALRTPEGFAAFVESLELNPDVSALNAALLADQLPGEIAGTAPFWKRNGCMVRKGETAAGWITGPAFTPRAVFTAEQVGATDLAGIEPEGVTDDCEAGGRRMLERQLSDGATGRIACNLAAEYMGLREVA